MISNSTISNSTFEYNITGLTVSNSLIDTCKFLGVINGVTITGNLTKCQFEGLSNNINITGPINDMTIQVDITPSSAHYVQDANDPSKLTYISQLSIDATTVPRLGETLHKECFIAVYNPGSKDAFVVQLATDDSNPSGAIIMFYPGTLQAGETLADRIPKGYAICDGTNGTPNLSGRFIRAAESYEDVGSHDNSDLSQADGSSGRSAYIQIHDYNLPPHIHTFDQITISDNIIVSGNTDSATVHYNYDSVSTGSNTISTSGEGSASVPYVSVSSSSGTDSHSHSINITCPISFSFTPTQQTDTFQNQKINIEPNAYALVFIMKL